MEVREPMPGYVVGQAGYQKTDGGLIPVDWRYTRLTEVARLESGHTPSRRKPSYWSGDISWVSLHDTESLDGNEITQTAQTISAEGLKNSSARILPKGTVIFSRTATVGKATVIGREMATSQDFANYICGPDVHNHFLVYLFRHMAPEWKKLMAGSIHNTVYMPAFRSLRVVLPPRTEQQAIAEALSDADALIESLSLLLAKKRQIKQGAMQELLTGKKRLPGFTKNWMCRRLGDLTKIEKGQMITTNGLIPGEVPVIAGGRKPAYFHSIANRWGKTITVSASGASAGYVAFHSIPIFASDCSTIAESTAYCIEFLFYALLAKQDEIYSTQTGGAQPHIQPKDLARLWLSIPAEIAEQAAVTAFLSDMDAELAVLEARIEKTETVKQGMMQELLTGRIRLVQPGSNVISMHANAVNASPIAPQPTHNWQINEAVVIGILAQRFGSEQFPLPRKRRVKLMYLLHRHAEGRAEGYLKKAAGPYDPNTKYKGPEAIALKNGYVRALHNGTYEGFVAGDNVAQAQHYFEQWYGTAALAWLEQFHYRKTDELELLATVDMAMVDLAMSGDTADVAGVKRVIAAHPEWVPKLSRELFSDDRIARAIVECQALLPIDPVSN